MKYFILFLVIIILGSCSVNPNPQYVTRKNLGTVELSQGIYFFDEGSMFVKASIKPNKKNIKINFLSQITELSFYSRNFPKDCYFYFHPQDSTVYFILPEVGIQDLEKEKVLTVIFGKFQIIKIGKSMTEEEFNDFWGSTQVAIIENLWFLNRF